MRYESELKHYGIPGQQWGKRNGPPYPLAVSKMSYKEQKAARSKQHRQARVKTDFSISALQNGRNNERAEVKSDSAKKFLIAAGLVSLAAVGGYVAWKASKNPNSIQNAGIPEEWPQKLKETYSSPDAKSTDSTSLESRLTDHFAKEVEPKLTADEKQAINDYSFSDGAMDINYYLERDENGNSPYRMKFKNKEMQKHFEQKEDRANWCEDHIRKIDSALEKTSTPEDMIVDRKTEFSNVRGMFGDISAKDLSDMLQHPEKAKGRELRQASYCSTSVDPEANSTFGQCNLHIFVPQGSRGMYVAPISGSPREKEFLLPRNSRFEVVDIRNFSQDPETVYFSSVEIFLKLIQ